MASKKNVRAGGRRRQATRAAAARAARGSRSNTLWYGVIALVVVLGVAGVMLSRGGDSLPEPPQGVRTVSDVTRNHVEATVDYAQTPPVGGDHASVWQNCGFYPEPITPETGVHSMEHGAVWITYRPTLEAEDIERLKDLTSQTYVLVSPWETGLPSPVVASAWGKQLRLSNVDDPRLEQFVRAFRLGPQTPEPNAVCTGGQGTPE